LVQGFDIRFIPGRVVRVIQNQKISQIPGVGEVTVGGGALPAVRVRLSPDALNRAGISTEDVRAALAAANAFLPKGMLENEKNFWPTTSF
jgi:multidrug efflux pump